MWPRGLFVFGLCIAVGLLAGCSSAPKKSPRPLPPATKPSAGGRIDFAAIPDAIPRPEPKSRYGNPASYSVHGKSYRVLDTGRGYVEHGIASWYGPGFHGKPTSTREIYDMYRMTAAHKSLPLPTYARITNLDNGRSIVVRINDRGPFVAGRVIDLSYVAAGKLGILERGTGRVEVRAIDTRSPQPDSTPQVARAPAPTARQPAATVRLPRSGNRADLRHIYLQVGTYADPNQARAVSDTLRRRRLPQRVHSLTRGTQVLYRVQIGPLASTGQAVNLGQELVRDGLTRPQVVFE